LPICCKPTRLQVPQAAPVSRSAPWLLLWISMVKAAMVGSRLTCPQVPSTLMKAAGTLGVGLDTGAGVDVSVTILVTICVTAIVGGSV
jgi:hypothetical protein